MLTDAGLLVIGEATDGEAAVAATRRLSPDVVLIDLKMPTVSGPAAVRRIAETSPDTRVVVLTDSTQEDEIVEALAAWACGYPLKETRIDELVAAIRLAATGHVVLSRNVLRAFALRELADNHDAEQAVSGEDSLTKRELEVIRLIAQGSDNEAIGRELSISKHTVKRYVANIFEKLRVQNRVEAAVYAVRKGLV